MREIDIGYFESSGDRKLIERSFKDRLIAWELGKELYDGTRNTGYGGYKYDGRWVKLIPRLADIYTIDKNSHILDIGCKKGFFLRDLVEAFPGIGVSGIDNHIYPIENGDLKVRNQLTVGDFTRLPYADNTFDLIIAISSIYMLNIGDIIKCMREIQRVGKGQSYITFGAYNSLEERELFLKWSLLGTTILHVDEWKMLFKYVGYTGDYYFTTPKSLRLFS